MITIEDNYLVNSDEAKNIIASWLDLWLNFSEENPEIKPENDLAA